MHYQYDLLDDNVFFQNQINSNKESIPEQSFGHRQVISVTR